MNMTTVVRTCMLVVVLVVLGTTSVFGQIVFTVGSPAGTPYNGTTNFNFAVNREGNRELFPAVSICAQTAGTGGAAATFDLNDVFTLTFPGANSPTIATTGTLGGNNMLTSTGTSATGAAVFTATAAMVQPPVVAPAVPGPPVATVTITVTVAPTAGSGFNCVTIQNLRFDLGNTPAGAIAGPPATGVVYLAAVTQISEGGGAAISVASATGNPAAPLLTGMPVPATNVLATTRSTLGTSAVQGFGNPTGYTTGNGTLNSTNAGINSGGSVATNPATGGGIASTLVVLTQNSGASGSGTVSVQQNPISAAPAAGGPFLPIAAGGGLFRGFQAAGPDVTTFLNSSGATTGTQVQIIVSSIPAGATVTFGSSASSNSGLVVWNMVLVGSGVLTSPGGTVTYATTINEGTPYGLDGTAAVGPSVEIPFTVAEPLTGGASNAGTRFVVQVGPTTAQGGVPTYNAVNGSTVLPSQAVTTLGQWALFRIAPNTSTRTYPYVIAFGAAGQPASYDTGIVLENNGKGTSGSNGGQDGTFTVFFIGQTVSATGTPSAPSVASIASTAAGIPNPGSLSSGGALAQGGIWQILASEGLKAAGVTGDWRGYVVISNNFPNSAGFAFISQFANPAGGATMGYIAQ